MAKKEDKDICEFYIQMQELLEELDNDICYKIECCSFCDMLNLIPYQCIFDTIMSTHQHINQIQS